MAWTGRRIWRELHFYSALLVCVALAFMAVTGFMGTHRRWFHPQVDRSQLAEARPLGGPCDAEALRSAVAEAGLGVVGPGDGPGGLVRVLVEDGVAACEPGDAHWYLGERRPLPSTEAAGRPREDVVQEALVVGGRRNDRLPAGLASDEAWRWEDAWGTTTAIPLEEAGFVEVWRRRWPVGFSLIEVHTGHNAPPLLMDLIALATLVTAVTGVGHGLRYPGGRRRVLVGLVLVSVLLWAGLMWG